MKIRRLMLFSLFVLLFSGPAMADDTRIRTREVVYYHKNGKDVKGYLALPGDNMKHPGIILIHEWWGLNNNIRKNAMKLAGLGYVALAVDLYEGRSATEPQGAMKLAGDVRSNMDEAFRNLKSAFSYLKARPDVYPERLASIGWCFGGGWSYQIAKNNLGARVSIIYYGQFNPKDDLQQMRALILGNFGAEDRSIKVDTVREFQAKLKTLSGDHEIYIYENAGHAFANEEGPAYNKEAADLAWQRTVAFLKKYL